MPTKKVVTEVKPKPAEVKATPKARIKWKSHYEVAMADGKRWRDLAESLSDKLQTRNAELAKERKEGYRLVMADIAKKPLWDRVKMVFPPK
jgi:hypothetical protein